MDSAHDSQLLVHLSWALPCTESNIRVGADFQSSAVPPNPSHEKPNAAGNGTGTIAAVRQLMLAHRTQGKLMDRRPLAGGKVFSNLAT